MSTIATAVRAVALVPHAVPGHAHNGMPLWPARLQELCGQIRAARDGPVPQQACSEVWTLLNASIGSYLRLHACRFGALSEEDRRDLAAEKSAELLRRIVHCQWDMTGHGPAEVAAFLSAVARNGLLDRLWEVRRCIPMAEEAQGGPDLAEMSQKAQWVADPPDAAVECHEYARALFKCAATLSSRARLIWFFRVFYSMSSKEISAHPEVGLKVGHVDVVQQRSRDLIRECMRKRGYTPQDMPPGTFAELWKAMRWQVSRQVAETRRE